MGVDAMIVVIGSGPSGVACAAALLERGRQVTLLDAGVELESDRQSALAVLGRQSPEEWQPDDIAFLERESGSHRGVLERKLVYGSDFPYRAPASAPEVRAEGVALEPSYAKGGFSTVWGGALLPYASSDLEGWPLQLSDLESYYSRALRLMGVSAVDDQLSRDFPLYCDHHQPLDSSRQAGELLARMERHRGTLARRGITFGHARIAVHARAPGRAGCVYCGRCLAGCPYGLIYNSADTLRGLIAKGLDYQPGWIVDRVEEHSRGIEIYGRAPDGSKIRKSASTVFLACGAVGTTRILLESAGTVAKPALIQDSQYFLLPLLQHSRVRGARNDRLHALSQLFLEIEGLRETSHRAHLQLYTYNPLYASAIRSASGGLASVLPGVQEGLLDRLLVVQGYLHSGISSTIEATLLPAGGSGEARLTLRPRINPRGRRAVREVLRRLTRVVGATGALPLWPLLKVGQPGRGFHSGGSFPMGGADHPHSSDTLGRPSGMSRVHIVDSSSFPTIPAGPITLTAMANSMRIADSAPLG